MNFSNWYSKNEPKTINIQPPALGAALQELTERGWNGALDEVEDELTKLFATTNISLSHVIDVVTRLRSVKK